ncbi:PQQ-binding-like beta-propeller repeat protein [Streptomyces sp. NPDC048172]|uniref:outer membrane protein assembly factor BamB family protein n=1 Tax=Streptomyces sp. NPDC048172 TaxID=3365505 RepID=UPI003718813B
MEPLRHDDPRRLGPYAPLFRLDSEASAVPAAERRFLAKSTDGHRTVVVTTPLPEREADAARFLAETERARGVGERRIPRVERVTDVAPASGGGELPWYASPFAPGIPLPEVVAAHGGPLPERTVRALGAVLAECLDRLHTAGHAHAGLSPRAVLVTGDGARLTGFGAVRAAGPDGEARQHIPGLPAEFVPPEQAAGGHPRPPGDVYALGALLAYAATGRTGYTERTGRLSLDGLPAALAGTVGACLAADPADRPTAAELLTRLLDGRTPSGPGPGVGPATVLDPDTDRAEDLLRPGWLPRGIAVALSVQASAVLGARIPEGERAPEEPEFPPSPPEAPALSTTVASPPAHGTGRRGVLTGLAAGAAGLAVGGTATWAATGEEPVEPTAAQRLAAGRRSRKRAEGMPPNPRWHRRLGLSAAPGTDPLIWDGGICVVLGKKSVLGLELATGDERWKREGLAATGPALLADGGLLLVPGDGLTALDARTGKPRWRTGKGRTNLLGTEGDTVWFAEGDRHIVACDVERGRRKWRVPLPSGTPADVQGHLLPDSLLLRSSSGSQDGGEGRTEVTALSRKSGEEEWARTYDGATGRDGAVASWDGMLVVADGSHLRGYDLEGAGRRPRWSLRTAKRPEGTEPLSGKRPSFGPPVLHKETVFVTDGGFDVWAVDVKKGERKWRAELGVSFENLGDVAKAGMPEARPAPDGRVLLSANPVEVEAFDAEVGTLLWRFTDLRPGARRSVHRRTVALTSELALVLSGNDAYTLPLD